MHELADFIARNVLWILGAATVVLLAGAALVWKLIQTYAPRLWPRALELWSGFHRSSLATQLARIPGVRRLATGALSVMRYLGVYAVCAFVVAGGAVAAFIELADEIGPSEEIGRFDVALSAALGERLSSDVLYAFSVITRLGDFEFLLILSALVALVLLAQRRWMLAAAWVIATASGGALSRLLKQLFARDRPFHEHGFAAETSFSFPSGHASGSMLVYGLLAYLIVRHSRPALHIPTALAACILIIFVGSSRVLLQVHYLSDVIAGYAMSAAWAALCVAGLEAVRRRGARRSR